MRLRRLSRIVRRSADGKARQASRLRQPVAAWIDPQAGYFKRAGLDTGSRQLSRPCRSGGWMAPPRVLPRRRL